MSDTNKVSIDADIAQWVTSILFPPPDSGRQGLTVNAGDPGFADASAMIIRARTQLGS